MALIATKHRLFKSQLVKQLVLLVVPTLVALVATSPPISTKIEHQGGLNTLFRMRGAITPPDDILIVTLNTRAADALELSQYSHTWPRSIYADAIDRLAAANAPLVVMDIAFKNEREPKMDAALAKALSNHGRVILFTYLKRHQINNAGALIDIEEVFPPADIFAHQALTNGPFVLPKYPANVAFADLFHREGKRVLASQPLLAFSAALFPESTNIEETTFKLVSAAQSAANYRAFSKQYPTVPINTFHSLRSDSPLVINFYGGPQTLPTLPIDKLFAMPASELAEKVRNKTVYIGYLETQQTEQQDAYLTVYSTAQGLDISGVEISATTFSNLVHGHSLRAIPASLALALNILLIALIWFFYRLSPSRNLLLQAALVTGYFAFAYFCFRRHYLWLPLVSLAITTVITNSFLLLAQYHRHKTQLRKVRYALRQYLPADAATQVSSSIASLSKQHQLVHGVVLMTDIKGYTTLSEELPPAELHQLMNRYYPLLIDSVKRHGGIVGNIVGDSLLALWTGPAITPEMAEAAYQCAEDIQQKINSNSQIKRDLPTCIALHGGQFSLGNLGANGHYEYSPVGDIINAASRIEHLNRDLGTSLLLSRSVHAQLAEERVDDLRYLGEFELRNKSKGIPLYTHQNEAFENSIDFPDALAAYENGEYKIAEDKFSEIFDTTCDGPALYYKNKIKTLVKNE